MTTTMTCPFCLSVYRLPGKVAGKKTFRSRCRNCSTVFPALGSAAGDRPLVQIAHPEPELRLAVAEILVASGYEFSAAESGNSALEQLLDRPHSALLVDCALPGMFAFELIEAIRNHSKIKGLAIILLSSVYSKTAYKRRPTSLYGADEYIEKHHLPDALVPKLDRLLALAQKDSGSAQIPMDEQDALNDRLKEAEEREVAGVEFVSALNKARRFARILVADISLYYQEKIDRGLQQGDALEVLAEEIAEGRRLLAEKVPPALCNCEDFFGDALSAMLNRRRAEIQGCANTVEEGVHD